jgi:hypothetical protein
MEIQPDYAQIDLPDTEGQPQIQRYGFGLLTPRRHGLPLELVADYSDSNLTADAMEPMDRMVRMDRNPSRQCNPCSCTSPHIHSGRHAIQLRISRLGVRVPPSAPDRWGFPREGSPRRSHKGLLYLQALRLCTAIVLQLGIQEFDRAFGQTPVPFTRD